MASVGRNIVVLLLLLAVLAAFISPEIPDPLSDPSRQVRCSAVPAFAIAAVAALAPPLIAETLRLHREPASDALLAPRTLSVVQIC